MKELAGLKVLDFTHKISGKYCTYTLSQYGAEVLKLENKYFSQKAKQEDEKYTDLNSKHKIITIDLEEEKGRASFYQLLKTTDIFVTCHSNDLLKKLKIDYETISAINPQVNMIHITGFGLTNEKISDSSVDELIFSKKENAPLMNGSSFNPNLTVPQYIAGMQGVIATLFALRVREKTGKGKFVDSGALHSMMSIFAQSLVVI